MLAQQGNFSLFLSHHCSESTVSPTNLKKGRLVASSDFKFAKINFDDQNLNAFSMSTVEHSGLILFIFAGRKSLSCDL